MRLIVAPAAVKALTRMPSKDAQALLDKLKRVAADPTGSHPFAKRLAGSLGYRIRQGDWRAVYRLDRAENEMVVERIAKRDEVYR
jgi:mRNA-degrading endonuclease RelE of RelBE toxin-antitoxin system